MPSSLPVFSSFPAAHILGRLYKKCDDRCKLHNSFEHSVHLYMHLFLAPTAPECHKVAGITIPGTKISAKGCWARGYSQCVPGKAGLLSE